jgi:hypothetical protein
MRGVQKIVIWDIAQRNLVEADGRFRSAYCTPSLERRISSAISLMMEAVCTYETSVYFNETKRRYTPEDYTIHTRRCENMKYYMLSKLLAVSSRTQLLWVYYLELLFFLLHLVTKWGQ